MKIWLGFVLLAGASASGQSRDAAAMGAVSLTPGAAQTILQPAGTTLAVNSLNKVLHAELFPGADIGAKINAAFASCGTAYDSCRIAIAPGAYTFSTEITVPSSPGTIRSPSGGYAEIDGGGSVLTWKGVGDAIQIRPQPSTAPTGMIENLSLFNASGNHSATNGIHSYARSAFQYDHIWVAHFNAVGASGIFLDNTSINGNHTGDAYFTERTYMNRVTTDDDTMGIRLLGDDGGTNSFGRTTMVSGMCGIVDRQTCLSIEGNGSFQSADLYDSHIEITGNASFATVAGSFVQVIRGGDIRRSVVNLSGERNGTVPGSFFYVDANNSVVNATGHAEGEGMGNTILGASDTFEVPELNGSWVVQGVPFQNGPQSANAKLIWDGNNFRYGLVNDGAGHPFGYFQLFGRIDGQPSGREAEVDYEGSGTNHQQNLMYVDAVGTPSINFGPGFGGVGFGAGYGPATGRGGTTKTIFPLESSTIGARNPTATTATPSDGGAWMMRRANPDGSVEDTFKSGRAGKPSNTYHQKFYSYQSSSYLTGFSCHVNGAVQCSIPGIALTSVPKLTCVATPVAPTDRGPGTFNYIAGAPGVKDTVQVCAKDATNTYAWRTIY